MVFSNDHIRQFATAWPSLEALHLPQDMRIAPAGAEPSLSALFELTEMCPQLKRVQIPLHVKDVPAATAGDGPAHASALEELIVGSQTGLYTNAEMLALARCLDRRFPRVRSLKHKYAECDRYVGKGLPHDTDTSVGSCRNEDSLVMICFRICQFL